MVQKVGSDADWPVFFVIPTTALQDISAEYFDSLYPTQPLNDDEIVIFTCIDIYLSFELIVIEFQHVIATLIFIETLEKISVIMEDTLNSSFLYCIFAGNWCALCRRMQ